MMETVTRPNTEEKSCDRSALLMMLSYVEAECRRLGSEQAAALAAMAAAAIVQAPAETASMGGIHLH